MTEVMQLFFILCWVYSVCLFTGCASTEPTNQCEYVKGKIFCEQGTTPTLHELNAWRKK